MNLLAAILLSLTSAEPAYVTAERNYAMNLLKLAEATTISLRSTKWSDPTGWSGGVVPADGAKVQIAAGHNVEIHTQLVERIKWIRVDGTLSFCRACDTKLIVDTIVVTDTGTLDMGTAASPITGNCEIIIADNGPIDLAADPKEFGRGIVAMGQVLIHGTPKTRVADLAASVSGGATNYTLTAPPTNWKPGETIVVAGTDWTDQRKSYDVCKIASVVGSTVNLAEPLKWKHSVPAPYKAFCINLDSNVVIRSEKPGYGTEPLNSLNKQHGHIMVMHDAVNRSVIKYAAFRDLGRTDKRVPLATLAGTNRVGRYILHFHRGMISGPPGIVEGCVAQGTASWGFTNHSSNVNFSNCATFDCLGAGFVGEIGDERGVIENCAAIYCPGDGSEGLFGRARVPNLETDFGFEGLGFWCQGPRIKIRNFKSANNPFGFGLWALAVIAQTPPVNAQDDTTGFIAPEDLQPDEDYVREWINPKTNRIPMARMRFDVDGVLSLCNRRFTDMEHTFPSTGASSLRNITCISPNQPGHFFFTYVWNVSIENYQNICDPVLFNPPYIEGVGVGGQSMNHSWKNCRIIGGGTAIKIPQFGLNRVEGTTFQANTAVELRAVGAGHELGRVADTLIRTREIHLTGNTFLDSPTGQKCNRLGWNPPAVTLDGILTDKVLVDGDQLYQLAQAATAIPFPRARPDVPPYLVGLTNQQMMDEYGNCTFNSIMPADATKDTDYGFYRGKPTPRLGVIIEFPYGGDVVKAGTVLSPIVRTYATGEQYPARITLPAITVQSGWNPITFNVDGQKYSVHTYGTGTSPPLPPPAAVAAIVVSPATATIETGKTQQFSAVAKDAVGNVLTGRSIVWAASIPNNATVSPTGIVTGVAAGLAAITATVEGKSASADVTVVAPPPPVILHDITRANSYDAAWKQAWQANATKVFSTPVPGVTKTPGLVIHVGDSMTLSQAYGQWISRALGRTADDLAIAAWMHAGQQAGDGFKLSGGGVTAFEGMGWSDVRIDKMLVNPQANAAQVAILMLNSPGQSMAIVETRCNQFIAKGILPVLSTVPPRTAAGYDAAVTDPYNLALTAVAKKLQLPLIDYNAEIKLRRPGGTWDGTLIGSNDVHPTGGVAGFKPDSDAYTPGGDASKHATGDAALNSGYLLRTWLTAQKLKEIRPLASVPVNETRVLTKEDVQVAIGRALNRIVLDTQQQADGTFKVTLGP